MAAAKYSVARATSSKKCERSAAATTVPPKRPRTSKGQWQGQTITADHRSGTPAFEC
jgi:hypothetical protein